MEKQALILGIGNILWADEGFGVRAVESLNQHYQFKDNVTVMDGGTQGIYLVQFVEQADILAVFDAIDYGLEPGTIKLIEGDDVPKFMGVKKNESAPDRLSRSFDDGRHARALPRTLIAGRCTTG